MSKNKKKHASKSKPAPEPQKRSASTRPWVIAGIVVVAIVGIVVALNGGSGESAAPAVSDNEYIGRLLPANYESPKVADAALYTAAISMTDVAATQDETGFTVALDSVVSNKIVRFDYTRSTGESLPMIAYVRPSGKLFVGVSYCPPCEGEGQRIEADGTLTCESCGTRRNLEDNTGLSGACKLYPLDEVPSVVDGSSIVVDSAILDAWTAQPLDRPVG